MKEKWVKLILIMFTCFSCSNHSENQKDQKLGITKQIVKPTIAQNKYATYDSIFKINSSFIANSFDYPVGKPDASRYYNAQKFGENLHLGDDWNGKGGGNTDLGDPIYAIANGYVVFAKNIKGGWGNVIRVIHKYRNKYYESIYAHCSEIKVKKGDLIQQGQLIGAIGNVDGLYYAHLHFELRDNIFMDIGGGYSKNTSGYLDPSEFIKNN